ncbi:response regulator transcription factor [Vallitalea okinawensis]|uniref:response regulator transcription factor n=1 Tax=Vallitalea okinawensis TaxID=2078660 RepID=UPI001478E06A|nr:response regulator [Vallitalea okinawensis]
MFKIVIIDDEPLSIRKLELLITKSQLPVEILGTANDGDEGLALIHEKKPNLIFSDIQMPKMDGLEMIRMLRDSQIETPIIILSCHENFYYAKEAIKLNTYDYLLKDLLDENSLNSLFARLIVDKPTLNKVTPSATTDDHLELQLQQLLMYHGKDSLHLLSQHYALSSHSNRFVLYYIKLAFTSPFFGHTYNSSTLKKLVTKLNQQTTTTAIITSINQNIIILDKIDCGASRLDYYTECQKTSRELVMTLKKENISLFMVSISSSFYHLHDINTYYQEVLDSSFNLLPSQMNPVFFANDTHYTPNMTYDIIDQNLQTLICYINEMDNQGVQAIIHELFNDEENGFLQINYLDYIHLCLLTCIKQSIDIHKIVKKEIFGYGHISFDEIKSLENLKEIESWYISKINKIINLLNTRKLTNYSFKISKCIQIIDANPSISLTELSDQIQTNKSYLCRLFKKEVKINLTDYTLNVRIEKAKKLLVETELKVNAISQELGYIYPHQFSKDFKKVTNIIPTDYRRKYQI